MKLLCVVAALGCLLAPPARANKVRGGACSTCAARLCTGRPPSAAALPLGVGGVPGPWLGGEGGPSGGQTSGFGVRGRVGSSLGLGGHP